MDTFYRNLFIFTVVFLSISGIVIYNYTEGNFELTETRSLDDLLDEINETTEKLRRLNALQN